MSGWVDGAKRGQCWWVQERGGAAGYGEVLIDTEENTANGVLIAGSVLTRSIWGTLAVPVGTL